MIRPLRRLTIGVAAMLLAGCAMISAGPTIPRDSELISALSGRWCSSDQSGKDCAALLVEIYGSRFEACPNGADSSGAGCVSGGITVDGRYVCADAAGFPGVSQGGCFNVSSVTSSMLVYRASDQVFEWRRE